MNKPPHSQLRCRLPQWEPKTEWRYKKMLVGAVIGRPCESIKGATDDRPYEEYDGRQKPLLEERCHEVTEWWKMIR